MTLALRTGIALLGGALSLAVLATPPAQARQNADAAEVSAWASCSEKVVKRAVKQVAKLTNNKAKDDVYNVGCADNQVFVAVTLPDGAGAVYNVEVGQAPVLVEPGLVTPDEEAETSSDDGLISIQSAYPISPTYGATAHHLHFNQTDPYGNIIQRVANVDFRTRLQLYYSPHAWRIGWDETSVYTAGMGGDLTTLAHRQANIQVTYRAWVKQDVYGTDPIVDTFSGGTFAYLRSYSQGDPKNVYTPSPHGKSFYVDMDYVKVVHPDHGTFYAGGNIRSLTMRCANGYCGF